MSIRARLALGYAVGIAASLCIVGLLSWWLMGSALRGSLVTTLQTQADGVVSSLENAGQAGLSETDRSGTLVFVALYAVDGTLQDATAAAPAGVRPSSGDQWLGGRDYLTLVRTAPDGTIVLTGASLQSIGDTQETLARVLIGVGLVVGAASLLAGWLLAGRALRPIGQLVADAAAIGPGDIEQRLALPARMDEIGDLALTLNRMLDRIAESVARQRLFVAMASHELRTPLAALRAGLEIVDRPDSGLRDYRDALREAQVDVVRLTDLSTNLLELASASLDAGALARSMVDLRSLTSTVVRGLEPMARRRGITVEAEAPAESVELDRTRSEHAIGNLVSNAITHGGRDVVLRCRVRGTATDRRLLVEVLDRGPGFGADHPETLFEPFRRGSGAKRSGSGLGLATVAEAVRAHGGTFGGENRAGGGAQVWFEIPV